MTHQVVVRTSENQHFLEFGVGDLPPVLSLEDAFGSIAPINQPENFAALREIAIEEHVQQFVDKLSE